ncbi:MAG: hypothetical protein WC516_05045 [Patescibacteria group bacterium]|jgi:hypothetical protein
MVPKIGDRVRISEKWLREVNYYCEKPSPFHVHSGEILTIQDMRPTLPHMEHVVAWFKETILVLWLNWDGTAYGAFDKLKSIQVLELVDENSNQINTVDVCKKCGTLGEQIRMCCKCPNCGEIIWGI